VKRACVPSARSARRHLPSDTELFPDELTQILDRRPENWSILGTITSPHLLSILYSSSIYPLFYSSSIHPLFILYSSSIHPPYSSSIYPLLPLGTLENGRLILLIRDDGHVGLFSPYHISKGDKVTYYGELLRDQHSYWCNPDRPISHARRNGQGNKNQTETSKR
jgi:hypothetical protein